MLVYQRVVSATKPSMNFDEALSEVMQMGADAFDIAAGQRRKRSGKPWTFF